MCAAPISRINILIAEDQEFAAMGLFALLKISDRVNVHWVTSGKEAIKALSDQRFLGRPSSNDQESELGPIHFDAVILDNNMEGTNDGVRVLAELFFMESLLVKYMCSSDSPATLQCAFDLAYRAKAGSDAAAPRLENFLPKPPKKEDLDRLFRDLGLPIPEDKPQQVASVVDPEELAQRNELRQRIEATRIAVEAEQKAAYDERKKAGKLTPAEQLFERIRSKIP
jgi:CheY-like chemotaxis protein